MSGGHTPTPWVADDDGMIREVGNFGFGVVLDTPWVEGAWSGDATAKANAAFIVRAVNAHDDLVAALRRIAEQDDIELALDPQWAKFLARHALSKAELP